MTGCGHVRPAGAHLRKGMNQREGVNSSPTDILPAVNATRWASALVLVCLGVSLPLWAAEPRKDEDALPIWEVRIYHDSQCKINFVFCDQRLQR